MIGMVGGGYSEQPAEETDDDDYMDALADSEPEGEPERGLCPNCGNAYLITAEWDNTTLCSERCVTEYLRYVEMPWGSL